MSAEQDNTQSTASEMQDKTGEAVEQTAAATEEVSKTDTAVGETATNDADAPAPAENGTTDAPEAAADDAADADAPAGESTPAAGSAKKNQKRRSSVLPEHKSKKLNRKKSMPSMNLDAKPGDYFWARLKGYPPWPAIICDEDMLPESLLGTRPVTAMRPDGTYRTDYEDAGKNARDRTYAVMYLGTNEFSWMGNTDLTRLELDEVKSAEQGKKSKLLWDAYQVAAEGNDLAYFKDLLRQHEQDLAEEAEEQARIQAEKAAKKEKKAKRKSKDAAAEGDVEMEDAEDELAGEERPAKEKKPQKKRKKETESDGENIKPAKATKTNTKASASKAANGDTPAKSKSKAKPKTPAKASKDASETEQPLTEDEKYEKRKKEVFFWRHKLQKGFLTKDQPPKEEDMKNMADYFTSLENFKDIDVTIIRTTKIHKVLKNIYKYPDDIPKDDEYHFKDRCATLLEAWSKMLNDDGDAQAEEEVKPNGSKSEAREEEKIDDTVAEKPAVDAGKKEDGAADETSSKEEAAKDADEAPAAEAKDEKTVDVKENVEDAEAATAEAAATE